MIKEDNRSILLVDDDEVDVLRVKRAFKTINLTNPLYVASNGLEALEMLRGKESQAAIPRPSIILLDLNMPKMNGFEFLQELRADTQLKAIPVVILTTSNDDKDKVRAFQSHVAGYLIKPRTGDNFVEIMTAFHKYWSMSKLPSN